MERELEEFQENSHQLEKELETQLEQADKTIRELRTRNNRLQLDSETLKVDLIIVTDLFCHFYRIFTHCQGSYRSVRYWFVLLLL